MCRWFWLIADAGHLSSSKHYRHDQSSIFARSTTRDVRSKYQPLMGLIQYEPLAHLVEREFPREKQHHFDGLSKKLNFRKSRRNGESQVTNFRVRFISDLFNLKTSIFAHQRRIIHLNFHNVSSVFFGKSTTRAL